MFRRSPGRGHAGVTIRTDADLAPFRLRRAARERRRRMTATRSVPSIATETTCCFSRGLQNTDIFRSGSRGLTCHALQPFDIRGRKRGRVELLGQLGHRPGHCILQVELHIDALLRFIGEIDDAQQMRRDETDDGGSHGFDPEFGRTEG